jgi:hypothetical protein
LKNVKALFRKGKILEKVYLAGTIPLLRKAITPDPDNKSIHNALSRHQERALVLGHRMLSVAGMASAL